VVHDLKISLLVDKAGTFERTINLQTDLPGREEVAIQVRAKGPTGAPR
jgi:hypothetical protein